MSIKHWETSKAQNLIQDCGCCMWTGAGGAPYSLWLWPSGAWRTDDSGEACTPHVALCILRNWAIEWLRKRGAWIAPRVTLNAGSENIVKGYYILHRLPVSHSILCKCGDYDGMLLLALEIINKPLEKDKEKDE